MKFKYLIYCDVFYYCSSDKWTELGDDEDCPADTVFFKSERLARLKAKELGIEADIQVFPDNWKRKEAENADN